MMNAVADPFPKSPDVEKQGTKTAVFMSVLNTHWLQANDSFVSLVTQKTPWYVPKKFCFHVQAEMSLVVHLEPHHL